VKLKPTPLEGKKENDQVSARGKKGGRGVVTKTARDDWGQKEKKKKKQIL